MISSAPKLQSRIPKGLELSHKVKLYKIPRFKLTPRDLERFSAHLPQNERHRWRGFKSTHARRNFLLSRLFLIAILRRDWGIALEDWYYTPKGKPKLKLGPAISWSHSKNHIIVGVGPVASLGVDVESTNRVLSMEAMSRILQRYSSPKELALFHDASPRRKRGLFFKLWCEKEAFAKCTGRGIDLKVKNHRKKPYEFYTQAGLGHYLAVCIKPFAHLRERQYKVRTIKG